MSISKNMKQVKKILEYIPEDRQPMAQGLFDELTFMQQTMRKLKAQVRKEGAIHMFTQGQNTYPREHPALTAYNKTIQRYNQTYKQLLDLLPEVTEQEETDPLIDFVENN